MDFLSNIISLANFVFSFARQNVLVFGLVILILCLLIFKKNYKKADTFLMYKTGMMILDGLFQAGKTRFMTLLARQRQKNKVFVLGNFRNGYNFIQWSSLEDLKLLLNDLLILGEYQNFTDKEVKKMYSNNKEVLKEKERIRKELKTTYKHIPYNGFNCNFLILGDEFQNYFYNRGAMGNFVGEKADFLTLLHQVRHFNSLCVFGTQNASELDVKFRKLSSLYVTTFDKGLLYGYNVYSFTTDKEFNLDIEKATKHTKVPVLKINYYLLNKIFNNINKIIININNISFIKYKFNNILDKEIIINLVDFRFEQLEFHTKFNVNPKISMYNDGDLFKKLNIFFSKQKSMYGFINNN